MNTLNTACRHCNGYGLSVTSDDMSSWPCGCNVGTEASAAGGDHEHIPPEVLLATLRANGLLVEAEAVGRMACELVETAGKLRDAEHQLEAVGAGGVSGERLRPDLDTMRQGFDALEVARRGAGVVERLRGWKHAFDMLRGGK